MTDETRTFFKGEIGRILREPDGQVTLILRQRDQTSNRIRGVPVTTSLEMSFVGSQHVTIPLEEIRQVVMQNGGIRYCSGPRCVEIVEFTKE